MVSFGTPADRKTVVAGGGVGIAAGNRGVVADIGIVPFRTVDIPGPERRLFRIPHQPRAHARRRDRPRAVRASRHQPIRSGDGQCAVVRRDRPAGSRAPLVVRLVQRVAATAGGDRQCVSTRGDGDVTSRRQGNIVLERVEALDHLTRTYIRRRNCTVGDLRTGHRIRRQLRRADRRILHVSRCHRVDRQISRRDRAVDYLGAGHRTIRQVGSSDRAVDDLRTGHRIGGDLDTRHRAVRQIPATGGDRQCVPGRRDRHITPRCQRHVVFERVEALDHLTRTHIPRRNRPIGDLRTRHRTIRQLCRADRRIL